MVRLGRRGLSSIWELTAAYREYTSRIGIEAHGGGSYDVV